MTTMRRVIVIMVSVLAIGALLASTAYFYWRYQQERQKNPEYELQAIIKQISQTVELPTDETPTLATVTEKEKLSQQGYFARAENGDKVLFFVKNGRAILYRPSTGKIIDIVPIRPTADTASEFKTNESKTTPDPATSSGRPRVILPKVALYNGTTLAGLTQTAQTKITDELTDIPTEITERSEATRRDYPQSLVVDITGRNTELVQRLTRLFAAQQGSLPEGEKKPNADVLVILGADFGE